MKSINFVLLLGCSFVFASTTFATPPSKQVIVGPEDTVNGIAYNNGIKTRALIAANSLKPNNNGRYILKEGQVLVIPAPNEHIVGDGETLPAIAEEYGVNVDVLAQENAIQSPFFVTPGTHLTIPPRDTESMAEALKPHSQEDISTSSLAPLPLIKSAPLPDGPNKPHASTLPTSSSGALPDDLAAELALEKGVGGAKLASDAAAKPMLMGNLAQGNAGVPIAPSKDEKEEKKPKKTEKKEAKKPEKKEEKKEKKKETEVKEVTFIWPVKGEVISKFNSGKNDGINIKVPEGSPVKASADGTVMYAGNELKGFGNLILIKHKDGWVTAYAHNSSLLVKKGDSVKQGQKIAKSGQVEDGKNGDVGEPQLHFEIRKVKQPVDPLPKLES